MASKFQRGIVRSPYYKNGGIPIGKGMKNKRKKKVVAQRMAILMEKIRKEREAEQEFDFFDYFDED